MKKLFLSFVLSVSITLCCEAQEFSFKQKPLMFFDNNSKQVILIDNDSIVIKTKHNIKFPLKTNGIPAPLSEFIPFTIKNKNYFVHAGCGVVLEYRNDSIVRIDKSFLHKNQFDAAVFVYNDEIYFFGGYGLFTYKNILTKYDFKFKEWVLVTTKGLKIPYTSDSFSCVIGNNLYVFGGSQNTPANVNSIYMLNLKTFEWKKFITNVFNDFKTLNKSDFNSFCYLDGLLINDKTRIYKYFDFKQNKKIEFETNFLTGIINSFYTNNIVHIISIKNQYKNNHTYLYESIPIKDILKNPISEAPFYYEEQPYYLYGIVGIFILLMLWFLYKKRRFISYNLSPTVPFQYWQEMEVLYFKGKKVKHLSDDDIKILNKMALHPNQFISLNEFNEMFTIDYENENYSAIVKRREKKLDTFLQMIANVSSYDFQDLIHERKNEVDKRIKEVLFLPKKIKFVKK
jgi:Kelch motif